MTLSKKDYEQFKQDVKSELAVIKQNQSDILACLKSVSRCADTTLKKIEATESAVNSLRNSVNADARKTTNLNETVKKLSEELAKLQKSTETNFAQFSEALNMVMVQNILDKMEILGGTLDNSNPQNNKGYYTKTCPKCGRPLNNAAASQCPSCGAKLNDSAEDKSEYKICPLCGEKVLEEEYCCVHCGYKFDANAFDNSGSFLDVFRRTTR